MNKPFGLQLHTVDIALVVAYFLIMISIGIFFSKRIRNLRDYFGGGGQVPWWLSGFSFYMTTFSAFGFVIYSQLAYKHGWTAITVSWMSTLGAMISAWFFAASWRRAAKTSALEFVEERFGILMRQGLAWLNIPLRTVDNGLKLFVIGTLVSGVLGFGEDYVLLAILFSGTIVFLYTVLGGLWAVLVTDFVQAIVMICAVAILLPLALYEVGGFDDLVSKAPEGFFSLTNEEFTVGYLAAWVVLLALNYSSSWSLVQRYYSVATDRDARKVGYLVAFLHFAITPMMFLPAIAARVLYPGLTDTETEQIYAMLCRNLLPVGMIGMLISAMFAATMSMVSSEYNAIASVMTNDIYARFVERDAAPKRLVAIGRLTTVIIGACCLGVAYIVWANPEGRNLFDIMVKVFSIFLPPIAIPMLAGITSRKTSNAGGLLGLALGMGAGLVGFALSQTSDTFAILNENQFMIPTTVGASLIGLIVGTWMAPSSEKEKRRIDAFFAGMEETPTDPGTGTSENGDKVSPLPIIGFSIALMGILLTGLTGFTEPIREGWVSVTVGLILTLLGVVLWRIDRNLRSVELVPTNE